MQNWFAFQKAKNLLIFIKKFKKKIKSKHSILRRAKRSKQWLPLHPQSVATASQ